MTTRGKYLLLAIAIAIAAYAGLAGLAFIAFAQS